jgi:hypothetical protein
MQLRRALRRRLEDTAIEELWPDDVLNDALAQAIWQYGARVPVERTDTVAVAAGARHFPVPGASAARGRVLRVTDPAGALVRRGWSDEDVPPGTQRWRWWQEAVRLEEPAAGGDWRVEYLGHRVMPNDDVSPAEVLPGDEPLLVTLAAINALHLRASAEAKRSGSPSLFLSTAAALRDITVRMFERRERAARGGVLAPAD